MTLSEGVGEKYEKLQYILRGLREVVVAFSGGIDSTFLLHAACDTLGRGKVTAFHGSSCLLSAESAQTATQVFKSHFADQADFKTIAFDPFRWKEFVENDSERCYFCKKGIYSLFLSEMGALGKHVLADGTNTDDLQEYRPGLRAIHELSVKTPLADAGFSKTDIRKVARIVGLQNYNLPSNSCLATRVYRNVSLTKAMLCQVEKAEKFLHENGFDDCRIRIGHGKSMIEISENDFTRICQNDVRKIIIDYFTIIHLVNPGLDLRARHKK